MPPIQSQMAAQVRAVQLDRLNTQKQRSMQGGASDPSALRDHIDVLKALGLRNQQIAQHPLVATHPLIAHHLADRFDRQTSRTYGQGQAPMREPTRRPAQPLGPPGGLPTPKGGLGGYTQAGPPRVLPHLPGYTPRPLPPPTGVAPMAPRPGAYRPTPGLRSQPPVTAPWLTPRFTGY